MKLNAYLDATYLKTATQDGLTNVEHTLKVERFIDETLAENYAAVIIRPEFVDFACQLKLKLNSTVSIGTVIDFPNGNSGLENKIIEATKALKDGADELDFVIDYHAFKSGDLLKVKEEVLVCTKLVLNHNKTIKWILETAALTNHEIVVLTTLVKNSVMSNFRENQYANVFVKSSTGFYETSNGETNGATIDSVIAMIENAYPLPVKASGGIKNQNDALQYIQLGVKRIGTSSAKEIMNGTFSNSNY